MKPNKSLLLLTVLIVFLAAACSQSRYGNLTRRTKAAHMVQQKAEKSTPMWRPKISKPAADKGYLTSESVAKKDVCQSLEKEENMILSELDNKKTTILSRMVAADDIESSVVRKTIKIDQSKTTFELGNKRKERLVNNLNALNGGGGIIAAIFLLALIVALLWLLGLAGVWFLGWFGVSTGYWGGFLVGLAFLAII